MDVGVCTVVVVAVSTSVDVEVVVIVVVVKIVAVSVNWLSVVVTIDEMVEVVMSGGGVTVVDGVVLLVSYANREVVKAWVLVPSVAG